MMHRIGTLIRHLGLLTGPLHPRSKVLSSLNTILTKDLDLLFFSHAKITHILIYNKIYYIIIYFLLFLTYLLFY